MSSGSTYFQNMGLKAIDSAETGNLSYHIVDWILAMRPYLEGISGRDLSSLELDLQLTTY